MAINERNRDLKAAIEHQQAGKLAQAAKLFRRILARTPDDVECLFLLAMLLAQQQKFGDTIELLRRAARIRPDIPDIHYNLAVALGLTGQFDEAANGYRRVIDLVPQHADARNNYAAALLQSGRHAEALKQYDGLIAQNPGLSDAHSNRGLALQALHRLADALEAFDRAIALAPAVPGPHINRGNVLSALGLPDEALASYHKAIALAPDLSDAHANAGNIYYQRGAFREATEAYDRALSLRPGDSETASMRVSAKMHLCDWKDLDRERNDIIASIRRGSPVYPFLALSISSSPEEQFQCARTFSEARYPTADQPLWRGESYSHDRIRVAYISGDFREHATANLLAGLFEKHDRSRFEVTGLSFGPALESPMRTRIANAFERFIDVGSKSDREIAGLVRELEIDIAVDPMGHTQGARTGIFACRAAPVQASYLGYLGTMGAKFIDYIVADRTVLPFDQAQFFSERIAHLPDCFLTIDRPLGVSLAAPSRDEAGLPADGFVFCSFNNSYKLTKPVFALWMRLLQSVRGSVLWLAESSAEAATNLRREARESGVDPQRIIFAPRIPLAEHLARHQLADLFLDTTPYNAGATAALALWCGVPVVTAIGNTFVGRMAASMLHAAGAPDLIAGSLPDYEALALKIVQEPGLCSALKDKLKTKRLESPLFDIARHTRHVEAAFMSMLQTRRRSDPPEGFAVEPHQR